MRFRYFDLETNLEVSENHRGDNVVQVECFSDGTFGLHGYAIPTIEKVIEIAHNWYGPITSTEQAETNCYYCGLRVHSVKTNFFGEVVCSDCG